MGRCVGMAALGIAGALWCGGCRTGARETAFEFERTERIANDSLELEADPATGRIVRFARKGGRNLLWIASRESVEADRRDGIWVNYGGDRIWPEIQGHWLQIHGRAVPDPVIDGGEYRIEKLNDRTLLMTSEVSKGLGVRLIRRVELAADAPRVRIDNMFVKEQPSPFPVQLWAITQIPFANYYVINTGFQRDYDPWEGRGYGNFGDQKGRVSESGTPGVLIYEAPPETPGKICTLGDFCAAVYDDCVLVQRSAYVPGNFYTDAGACMAFAGRRYAELEFSGGLKQMKVGDRTSQTVFWDFFSREPGEEINRILDKIIRAAIPATGPRAQN